jgi:tetratricopeptide (TPR) repeat protein
MPSHLLRIRTVFLATLLALGLSGGCATTSKPDPNKKAQPGGSILTTGTEPKVTSQQSADVWIALGRSFEEEGKPEEARSAYLSALKKDSKRADAEVRVAILDDRAGNAKEADRRFAQALKLDPKNPEILCDRGYCLSQRKQLDEAATLLKQALTINPLHQRSHNNLAMVLARQGDIPAALREFTKAGCDTSDTHANLGLVMAMEGHFEESKKQYVQALTAKPNSTTASKGLQATIVALAGQGDPTALATRVVKPPTPASPAQAAPSPTDPAIMRTSAQTGSN